MSERLTSRVPWDQACASVHFGWGQIARHSEAPPSPPVVGRGPRWWRTVQALANEGAVEEPYPLRNRARHVATTVLARAWDEAHDKAFHGSHWAASREDIVAGCCRKYRAPALQRHTFKDVLACIPPSRRQHRIAVRRRRKCRCRGTLVSVQQASDALPVG